MKNSILVFLSISFCLLACDSSKLVIDDSKNTTSKLGLIHTVYFWYTDDADKSTLIAFEKSIENLGNIPTVVKYYYGPPAATKERGPLDNTYDMAVNIFFEDLAGHDVYQLDPIHLNLLAEYKHIWKKVKVYDNIISK